MFEDDQGGKPPEDGASYDVGYCKPPRQYRFEKGKSGNPAGRPKGRKRDPMPVLAMLDETIVIVEGSKRKKVTKEAAWLARMYNGAINGKSADTKNLLSYMKMMGAPAARAKQLAAQEIPHRMIIEYVQGPSPMKTPVRT